MLGAIAGDIIGSRFEGEWTIPGDFTLFTSESRFTDDTVLTCAVADALLSGEEYGSALRRWARLYPQAGYGGRFLRWVLSDDGQPYGSAGNGSAMRVSPVGWFFDDLETVLAEATRSAAPTHNSTEGVAGAQVVAGAVFLARTGQGKEAVRRLGEGFGYAMDMTMADARGLGSGVLCAESVPQALTAFLESDGFEDAVRKAVSIGGDTDTVAAITGAVAEAHYGGLPRAVAAEVAARLDPPLARVVEAFARRLRERGRDA